MPVVEGLVEIAAPRQTVWEFMADPSRHTELGTFVDEVTLATKGEICEGTVYYERSGPAFMKSKSEWTITSFDPPHSIGPRRQGKFHDRRSDLKFQRGRLGLYEGDPVSQFSDDAWIPTTRKSARGGLREAVDAARDREDVARPKTHR
ncbi:MAG: SRPBCC family protein [Actinomycetota bacterium]|nr:SRPBCC family protein [Actinomycetota bacterium]